MTTKTSKIFDVSHPGKAAPSSSSKPIIVTNRPIIQDPMMVTDEPTSEEAVGLTKKKELKIEPLNLDASDSDSKSASEDEGEKITVNKIPKTESPDVPEVHAAGTRTISQLAEAAKADREKAAALASESATETDQDTTPNETATASPEPTEEPATADSIDVSGNDLDSELLPDDRKSVVAKDADEAAAKAETERLEAIQKLVESRKYELPINAVHKRHAEYLLLTVSVLLLACIGGLAYAYQRGLLDPYLK